MAADGGVEGAARVSVYAAERVFEYRLRQERYRHEENEEQILEDVASGRITQNDARKLLARAKMHQDHGAAQMDDHDGTYQAVMAGADYTSTNMMLESMLDREDDLKMNPLADCLFKAIGVDKLHRRVMRERRRRKAPDFVHPAPLIARMVGSTAFELVVGTAMMLNSLLIGFQASEPNSGAVFDNLEQAFTFFFVIEMILRLISEGWVWIWDKANFFDLFLTVFTGVLPMWILKPAGIDSSVMRAFAVLRVLRMVRLVKMVRTYSMFRIFWSLIRGVLDSGRTLLYTYMIISMVLYIFGIFAVYLIFKDERLKEDPVLEAKTYMYYGDVPKAMFTLFQVITTDGWAEVVRPLMKKSNIAAPLHVAVICVVTTVCLNLVTAVIVNNAFERAKQDQDLLAVQRREAMEQEIKELQNLFFEIDIDKSGMLSKEEYDSALTNNEDVIAKFEILQIAPKEYEDIWNLLDDGDGEVSVSQFADLLRAIKGDAKAKDSFSILRRVYATNSRLGRLSKRLEKHRALASELRTDATQVRQQLGALQHEMCDFISLLSDCVPPGPADVKVSVIEQFNTELQDEVSRMF